MYIFSISVYLLSVYNFTSIYRCTSEWVASPSQWGEGHKRCIRQTQVGNVTGVFFLVKGQALPRQRGGAQCLPQIGGRYNNKGE